MASGKAAVGRVKQNNAGVELAIAHVQSSVPVSLQKYLGFGINWLGAEARCSFCGWRYCAGGICSGCLCSHGP